jgi:hypothetical protein
MLAGRFSCKYPSRHWMWPRSIRPTRMASGVPPRSTTTTCGRTVARLDCRNAKYESISESRLPVQDCHSRRISSRSGNVLNTLTEAGVCMGCVTSVNRESGRNWWLRALELPACLAPDNQEIALTRLRDRSHAPRIKSQRPFRFGPEELKRPLN